MRMSVKIAPSSFLGNAVGLTAPHRVLAAVYNLPFLYTVPSIASPMSAVAGPSSRPVQLQQSQQNVHPWEFTRRKRWADLLVTELSEAIVLVLSSRRKVLFCNPAVREILGWQDEELIDSDFKDFVNGPCLTRSHSSLPALICDLRHTANDRLGFCERYARSIDRREELQFYARFFCKSDSFTHTTVTPPPVKEVLLEIVGYPHFIMGESTCRCFFVVAKPYPSRNVAM
jgi:PAS domain-containing protein